MPKLTKEDYKERFSKFFGESPDDNALSFMEDLTDTLEELYNNSGNNNAKYTEEQYKELDAKWRKKYTERFYSNTKDKEQEKREKEEEQEEKAAEEQERLEKITIDDLFENTSK